jgi:hypothetical protein
MKDEMTGLAEEIRSLHSARAEFRNEIRNRVLDLRSGVRELRTGYGSARAEMARTMRQESHAFLAGLRKTVAEIEHQAQGTRRAFAADLAGALAAWAGRTSSVEKSPAQKPHRSRRGRAR